MLSAMVRGVVLAWLLFFALASVVCAGAKGSTPPGMAAATGSDGKSRQRLESGTKYFREKKYDLALREIQAALSLNPSRETSARAYALMGDIFFEKEDLARAEEHYLKAVALFPNLKKTWNNLGLVYAMQGDLERGINCFQKSSALDPRYTDPLYNTALAYSKLAEGQTQTGAGSAASQYRRLAIQSYQRVVQADPRHARAYLNLGNLLSQEGELGEAMEQYRKVIAIDPKSVKARYNLGTSYLQQRDYLQAEQELQKVIQLDPSFSLGYLALGRVGYEQGDLAKAEIHLRKSLELDPSTEEAHFYLGNILQKRGDRNGAIQEFERVVQLNPRSVSGHFNLGTLYYQAQRSEEARGELQKALSLDPNHSPSHYHLGIIHQDRKEYQKAEEEYLAAIAIKKDYMQAHYQLGLLYKEMAGGLAHAPDGQMAQKGPLLLKAKGELEAAEALNPQDFDTKVELARVLDSMAVLLKERGRAPESLQANREALKKYQEALPLARTEEEREFVQKALKTEKGMRPGGSR